MAHVTKIFGAAILLPLFAAAQESSEEALRLLPSGVRVESSATKIEAAEIKELLSQAKVEVISSQSGSARDSESLAPSLFT